MHPALGPAALLRVQADAAGVRQQSLGILGHKLRRGVFHLDVCRGAVQVLALRAATHFLVVGHRAVGAGNGHRAVEMVPDVLQQLHQFIAHEDRVGAVLAGKLPYLKVGAQFLLAVPGERIAFDSHNFSPPF